MKTLGISIKTHLRSQYLSQCVESIEKHFADLPYRIYIADDSELDDEKRCYYDTLRARGHFVLELPYDIGICAGRNALLEHMTEHYVLRIDDDFLMTKETDIASMMRILELVPNIGALSSLERQVETWKGVQAGELSGSQGNLERQGRRLVKHFFDLETVEYDEIEGLRYKICDFTRNFLLIRREMLDEIRWEERLKIHGEHLDFMLQIGAHPYWKLAYTPDSVHLHAGPPPTRLPEEYTKLRYRRDAKWDVLRDKWGIEQIDFEEGGRRYLLGRTRGFLRKLGL